MYRGPDGRVVRGSNIPQDSIGGGNNYQMQQYNAQPKAMPKFPSTGGGLQLGGMTQGSYSAPQMPQTGGGLQYSPSLGQTAGMPQTGGGLKSPVSRFTPQSAPGYQTALAKNRPSKLALALGGM